jgi:AbrB family looped-hinge helix DNA binding protein
MSHYSTRLSSKGQLVIPKQIRDKCDWDDGTEFDVIETEVGILLRPKRKLTETRIDAVFGMVGTKKKLTVEDMNAVLSRMVP